jgi:hypothetical protein
MMSSRNVVRLSVAVGRCGAVLLMVALLFGCQKAAPKRAKHARPHPSPTSSPSADDDPATPAPAPPASGPPAAAARPPEAPPAPRHQLSVDRNPPPPVAPAPRRAPPTPSPPARPAPDRPVVYKAVDDPRPHGLCDGSSVKGELLSVQGVAANDVLNIREAPDHTSTILGELPPDATGVHGTANRKRVGGSNWREVECGKLRGWVNERFLARESGGN